MIQQDFAEAYFNANVAKTPNEIKLIAAIRRGDIKPTMSLHEMANVTGIKSAETVKYYLRKFMKEQK